MQLKQFLIVDDDERFAVLVAKRLERYAKCVIALNGDDAALQFEHHLREKAPFTAVFMDICMPGMDGHAVVNTIREIEKRNGVSPINAVKLVMLTCKDDSGNVTKAFFHGDADAYILKSDFNEKLLEELKNINLI